MISVGRRRGEENFNFLSYICSGLCFFLTFFFWGGEQGIFWRTEGSGEGIGVWSSSFYFLYLIMFDIFYKKNVLVCFCFLTGSTKLLGKIWKGTKLGF